MVLLRNYSKNSIQTFMRYRKENRITNKSIFIPFQLNVLDSIDLTLNGQ